MHACCQSWDTRDGLSILGRLTATTQTRDAQAEGLARQRTQIKNRHSRAQRQTDDSSRPGGGDQVPVDAWSEMIAAMKSSQIANAAKKASSKGFSKDFGNSKGCGA